MRAFEQYSHRPGERARYLDGGVLEPGFCLDQFLAYPIALDRYVTAARDASILDEPLVQDVLREIDDALFVRLDPEYFLCATELLPSGEKADYPFVAYDNALVWRYADALPRIWRRRQGDPPPRFDREAAVVNSDRQRLVVDRPKLLKGQLGQAAGVAEDQRGAMLLDQPHHIAHRMVAGVTGPGDAIFRDQDRQVRLRTGVAFHQPHQIEIGVGR